jgi:hypothetical protein
MNDKHTPGLWVRGARDKQTVYDREGQEIALSFTRPADGGIATTPSERYEALANARLIAAAPTMLAALRAALASDYVTDEETCDRDLVRQLRAAVRAATGKHE